MAHPDRYRLIVARSPGKAARQLDHARRRLVELEAGATPAGQDDTVDARNAEIDGLTEGPKCWAKRRKAGLT